MREREAELARRSSGSRGGAKRGNGRGSPRRSGDETRARRRERALPLAGTSIDQVRTRRPATQIRTPLTSAPVPPSPSPAAPSSLLVAENPSSSRHLVLASPRRPSRQTCRPRLSRSAPASSSRRSATSSSSSSTSSRLSSSRSASRRSRAATPPSLPACELHRSSTLGVAVGTGGQRRAREAVRRQRGRDAARGAGPTAFATRRRAERCSSRCSRRAAGRAGRSVRCAPGSSARRRGLAGAHLGTRPPAALDHLSSPSPLDTLPRASAAASPFTSRLVLASMPSAPPSTSRRRPS